jgi:hypothetical protein
VHKGTTIAVQGSTAAQNATTINATAVTIILPQIGGVVTATSSSTIVVTGFDGATHTILVGSSTRYLKAGHGASLADITIGTRITAEGTLNTTGSLNAVLVTIQLPRLGGQVTAVHGSTYTVSGPRGSSATIDTTGSTTYINANGSTASASAVKTGVYILAEGTLSSDGTTLTAQRITIVPAGAGHVGRIGSFGADDGSSVDGGFGGPLGGTAPQTNTPTTGGTPSV